MSDDTRAGQEALHRAVVGVWLATFASVAVAAIFVPRSPQPHGALVATTLVFVLGVLVTARRAAARGGAFVVVSTGIVAAGAIPSLVCLSIYAATRPIVACYALDCGASIGVAVIIGGVSTVAPLAGTTALASLLTTLRGRGHGPVVALASIALAIASALSVYETAHAFRVPTVDRYVETISEVGRVPAAKLPRGSSERPYTTSPVSKELFDAQWSAVGGPNPCHLSIGGGGYDIAAARRSSAGDPPSATEVECPEVRIRHDHKRGVIVVDEPAEGGGFTPAFVVSTSTGISGPLRPLRYEIGSDVAAPRLWIIMAAAGVVAALALLFRRLLAERRHHATWLAARLGTHRGDGWIAFDDDDDDGAPPIHLASAAALPVGPVHVIGASERAAGGVGGYRSAGPHAAEGAMAGDRATMTLLSKGRMKSTLVIAATMAAAATVPLAAAMFILTLD